MKSKSAGNDIDDGDDYDDDDDDGDRGDIKRFSVGRAKSFWDSFSSREVVDVADAQDDKKFRLHSRDALLQRKSCKKYFLTRASNNET